MSLISVFLLLQGLIAIEPWAPKVAFWIKKTRLSGPLLASCFEVSRKVRKCEISEEYHAKSKAFDLLTDCSFNFRFFSETPRPERMFQGSKCPSIIKNTVLERSAISWGAENRGSALDPTWARFGAGNVPRMHFHRSGIVFRLIYVVFQDFDAFSI